MLDEFRACERGINLPYDAVCSRQKDILFNPPKWASIALWRRALPAAVGNYVRAALRDPNFVAINMLSLTVDYSGGTYQLTQAADDRHTYLGHVHDKTVRLDDIFRGDLARAFCKDVEQRIIDAGKIFNYRPLTFMLRTRTDIDPEFSFFHLDKVRVLGCMYSRFTTQIAPADAVEPAKNASKENADFLFECTRPNDISEISPGDVALVKPCLHHRGYYSPNTKLPRIWVGLGLP